MRIKRGVLLDQTSPPILYALGVAEAVYHCHGHKMVVTSLLDGTHGEHSLHYSGRAADLRTRNMPISAIVIIRRALVSLLNPLGYDVVLESDHLHLEFDPKAQETWVSEVD